MSIPLPDIPDTAKLTDGNDAINATRQALNGFYSSWGTRVQSVALGGTGATSKHPARNNLGITSGTANPSGGSDGDIYFKIV